MALPIHLEVTLNGTSALINYLLINKLVDYATSNIKS